MQSKNDAEILEWNRFEIEMIISIAISKNLNIANSKMATKIPTKPSSNAQIILNSSTIDLLT